jgi:hypothetical protein
VTSYTAPHAGPQPQCPYLAIVGIPTSCMAGEFLFLFLSVNTKMLKPKPKAATSG